MNQAEATYWKDYINRVIHSILSGMTSEELAAAEISAFENAHMQTITGQQLLPQSIFRIFLRMFSSIPEQQRILNEKISWIDDKFNECSEEDIYAMFSEDLDLEMSLNDLSEIDNEGYIIAPNIPIDEEGYIRITESAIVEDGYIVELN